MYILVETKRATPRDDAGPGAGQTVSKVFIGGLKDGVSDDNLKEYFGTFGTVLHVEQMTDKATGRKRGFGFVEFDDYDSVDKLMLAGNNHIVNGYKIDVKKAISKSIHKSFFPFMLFTSIMKLWLEPSETMLAPVPLP